MTEQPAPDGKKRVPPVALIGAGVAIAASLVAVFVATGNRKDDPNAPAQVVATEPVEEEVATIQFGQSGQTTPPPVPATPDPGAPAASADGALAYADEFITFSAAIPPGPADDPVLTYLRTDAQAYFTRYKANARTDAEERKQNGAPAMPWEVKIDWEYTAKAGNIVSLVGTAYEFTGGAHGMTHTDTHIANADTGKQLDVRSMLHSGALSPAVVIGVCEALKKVKLTNMGSATIYDEPIVCAGNATNIKIEEAKFALAPSTEPNKFGGLFVYYEPYAVGSYSEGSYSLTIPNEVFREDLLPEYKALFGGKVPPAVH